MPDITALIMDDHDWLRRRFAELDDAREPALLQALWQTLAHRLEVHARAEEHVVYPALLKRACIDGDEVEFALDIQRRIRDAVAEAAARDVASPAWHDAVQRARVLNSRHLTIDEDGALPDFRKHAPHRLRTRLGSEWQRFHAASQRSPQAVAQRNGVAARAFTDRSAPMAPS